MKSYKCIESNSKQFLFQSGMSIEIAYKESWKVKNNQFNA